MWEIRAKLSVTFPGEATGPAKLIVVDQPIHRMSKELGMSLAQIAQGQGASESPVRRVLKVEEVEALPATAFKDGWD